MAVDRGIGGFPGNQFRIGCGTAPGTDAQILQRIRDAVAIEVQRPVALDHVIAGLAEDHVIASPARNVVVAIGRGDHGGRGEQPDPPRRALRVGLRKRADRGGPRNGPRAHIGRGPDHGPAVAEDHVMARAAINQVAAIRGGRRADRGGHSRRQIVAADDVIIPGAAVDRVSALAAHDHIIAGATVDHIRAAAMACAGERRLDRIACGNLQEACRLNRPRDARMVPKQQVVARRTADPVCACTADDQVVACACRDYVVPARGREQCFHQSRQIRTSLRIGKDHPPVIAQNDVRPGRRAGCSPG